MKTRLVSFSLALLMGLTGLQAEASKRLGGGQSTGRQSSNVTQREAARPAPATPAQNTTSPAAQPAPAAAGAGAAAAQTQRKPWGAMLGGLAAGLGLAWLAHSLGLGEAFGQILLFGLLALLIMVAVGFFLRRRSATANNSSPYAFQGAGAADAAAAPQYNPKNVGNDASARPWEGPAHFEPAAPSRAGARIGSSLIGGGQNWSIPADFDVAGFVSGAKANFVSLQDAWDRSDMDALRAMMTDEMTGEIRQQLAERESQSGGQPNKTEVVMLEAQILGIEDLGSGYLASVEFSGLIREDVSSGPTPFREVWNMTRTKEGGDGWLVAGVQALQ
ncbi:MAG: Tim44-like domain-containing protein [Alphaproteobacteria bacterium]|nr:Tim44-like domain-containing protein [Alphaproteobacteria bacterium]